MGPGKEAVTVRQVVLVVVLVAAAFLGGAFVNGPGLRWARTQVLGSLGLREENEIASVDLKGATNPEPTGEGARPTKNGPRTDSGPLAPIPSLVTEDEAGKSHASDRHPPRPLGDARRPASPPALTGPIASSPAAVNSRKAVPRAEKSAPRSASDTEPPALLDPSVKPASTTPIGGPATLDREVAPALLNTLASLMPAGPPPPDAASPSVETAPPPLSRPETKPETTAGEDWAALGRKMHALGVTRFSIEGTPGGPVVFSCLIPLAGRQAVAQRFEAEADDGYRAAQAALRRVALWRATQPR